MLAALILAAVAGAASGADVTGERVKLYTEQDGVYRITWEELASAGEIPSGVPVGRVALSSRGQPVARWVEDGNGNGRFDHGDAVVWVAQRLPGAVGFLNEYSRYNCTFLSFDGTAEPGRDVDVSRASDDPGPLKVTRHLEDDLIMVRFAEEARESIERWYWARLSVADREPFEVTADVSDLIADQSEDSVTLRIGLRGWSRVAGTKGMAEHAVRVDVAGATLATVEFSGRDEFVAELTVPRHAVRDGRLDLRFSVPERQLPSGDLFVDVVLLNWVELVYERSPSFTPGQWPFRATTEFVDIRPEGGCSSQLYSRSGWKAAVDPSGGVVGLPEESGPRATLFAVVGDGFKHPEAIVVDRPSDLRSPANRADYLMVTHASLVEALEPLAKFHRERGLVVRVVDVEDIYDEFNHGIFHPRAIRDFVRHASTEWRTPRPGYLLLAGDATWDPKNSDADDERYADWTFKPRELKIKAFVKNTSTPYSRQAPRNLVPTWNHPTYQGHAASDNYFVSLDDGDHLPDLAVGRFAVATAEEMAAVVAKTIRYATSTPDPAAEWPRRVLLITNESGIFQRRSDRTAEHLSSLGLTVETIYPQPEEKVNEHHTAAILDTFAHGVGMVQFLGHGGRYIWRTGPPDYRKNHDLFTLDHLDELPAGHPLPVVISLTCYSAPFDHPTADSIGEKLLRLPDRGAIAVFAASWRNSPSASMGEIVMNELLEPGVAIGEAIRRAKHRIVSEILVETYNLLGDPAVVMHQPQPVATPNGEEKRQ